MQPTPFSLLVPFGFRLADVNMNEPDSHVCEGRSVEYLALAIPDMIRSFLSCHHFMTLGQSQQRRTCKISATTYDCDLADFSPLHRIQWLRCGMAAILDSKREVIAGHIVGLLVLCCAQFCLHFTNVFAAFAFGQDGSTACVSTGFSTNRLNSWQPDVIRGSFPMQVCVSQITAKTERDDSSLDFFHTLQLTFSAKKFTPFVV